MAKLNSYLKDYTVFDLETTGLDPEKDEIIEISGIQVRNGQMTGRFSTLVNPGRPIPPDAARINGITDEMVREAPALKTALQDFLAFVGNDRLVDPQLRPEIPLRRSAQGTAPAYQQRLRRHPVPGKEPPSSEPVPPDGCSFLFSPGNRRRPPCPERLHD